VKYLHDILTAALISGALIYYHHAHPRLVLTVNACSPSDQAEIVLPPSQRRGI
jgi:hypothetical protein